jgi:sterol desaturase/sphingolipid hydroxylase (fatty acid hydroxylase superfamily)
MDWLIALTDRWLVTMQWLAGLALAFGVLARLFPCNPGMYWWKDRRAVATDLVYWFAVPLVMLVGRVALLAVAVVLVFGGGTLPESALARWPLWVQAAAVLLIQDVILYWLHRAFHTRVGWHFHAVHHSPRVLDWVSLARFHPVNQLLEFAVADVVILLMGFPPAALVALAPLNLVYSAMTHANLNWTFGPLRFVFASPVFHRWHHTSEVEGLDKNFAPTFPLLDLLFGTFHMPAGELPREYGVGGEAVPAGFWGQLVYPFRGAVRRPVAAAVASLLIAVGLFGGWKYVAARLPGPTAEAEASPNPALRRSPQRVSEPVAVVRAASADGRVTVQGEASGAVRVRGAGGDSERTYKAGGVVTGVAVSADGRRVAAGARQVVKVWDTHAGQEITMRGHTGLVSCVAMTPDGSRVAAGGFDGAVRVWDAATGELLASRAGDGKPVASVAFDGERIVIRGTDGKRAAWEPGAEKGP